MIFWISYSPSRNISRANESIDVYLSRVFSGDFGYALVGAKAASLDDSFSSYGLSSSDLERAKVLIQELFGHSKSFIFRDIAGRRWLINRKKMARQIRQYKELRSFVFERFGSEERFVDQIECGDFDLFQLLDDRDDLVSIVFGYGRDNGKFFNRRMVVGEYLQKYPVISIYPFDDLPWIFKARETNPMFYPCLNKIEKPPLLPEFSSLEEEWSWIKQNEWNLCEESLPEPPYYLKLPTYISCKSSEAKEVHRKFVKARGRLAKMFAQGRPSEVIASVASN
jgi:hypothetical protein